jgi:cysteine synthase A
MALRRRKQHRMTVLDPIGRTRLMPLQRIVPKGSARILLKLEYENPTGSMKDRMALAMVEAAEADGRLQPGGQVVEYTGGSTGVSLAFVCAAKRIPLQIVTSDAFSKEKRDHMAALGARLTLVPSPTGGTTKALTLEMIETARKLASAPGELLDGSVEQYRSALQLRADGQGNMGADQRAGERVRPECGHGRILARDCHMPSHQ